MIDPSSRRRPHHRRPHHRPLLHRPRHRRRRLRHRDIRPDSPRSVDSGEHESDAEFIDDNVDLDADPDDLYTRQ